MRRGRLVSIIFDFDGIEIATTRPELLAACVAVAVHPDDERLQKDLEYQPLCAPFLVTKVPVVVDEAVDPAFGSGAVMICTFGDKQDVHWWKQHNLALRKAIDRKGKMTVDCREIQGYELHPNAGRRSCRYEGAGYSLPAGTARPAGGDLLAVQDADRDT